MTLENAAYFEESQLSKDQVMEDLGNGLIQVQASVPFTSQLVWWLRSFGRRIQDIEPIDVYNAVYEVED